MLGYADPAPLQIVLPDPTPLQLSPDRGRKWDVPIPAGYSSISALSLLVRRVPADLPTHYGPIMDWSPRSRTSNQFSRSPVPNSTAPGPP